MFSAVENSTPPSPQLSIKTLAKNEVVVNYGDYRDKYISLILVASFSVIIDGSQKQTLEYI